MLSTGVCLCLWHRLTTLKTVLLFFNALICLSFMMNVENCCLRLSLRRFFTLMSLWVACFCFRL